MREEAERILEADPGHSGARHLLGRLHAGIMRMSGIKRFLARTLFGGEVMEGASWEVARRHLEAAAEGAPCLPHHHFELARLYEDTGRHGDAVREAGHVLQLQDLHPQYQETGRKASALLERLAPEPTGGAGSQGG